MRDEAHHAARAQFVFKQGASSHNLALRETQRQREEVPFPEGRVDLSGFKDEGREEEEEEEEEGSPAERKVRRSVLLQGPMR